MVPDTLWTVFSLLRGKDYIYLDRMLNKECLYITKQPYCIFKTHQWPEKGETVC